MTFQLPCQIIRQLITKRIIHQKCYNLSNLEGTQNVQPRKRFYTTVTRSIPSLRQFETMQPRPNLFKKNRPSINKIQKYNFSTLKKLQILDRSKKIFNKPLMKNTSRSVDCIQTRNLYEDFEPGSSQELEERHRKLQREKFECDDPEALKIRRTREDFKSLGCCDDFQAKLEWNEDIPIDPCFPCTKPCPKDWNVKRLVRRFEDTDPTDRCPKPEKCVRLDDGLEVHKKCLPKMEPSLCPPCTHALPCSSPLLKRPKPSFDDTKMKWKHDCPPDEPECEERMDEKNPKRYKRLKKYKTPNTCKPCWGSQPIYAPPLRRMKFVYEDPPRICPKDVCKWKPDVKKYKALRKITFGTCKPCRDFPTCAPVLKKPKRLFEDDHFKWQQVCEEYKCPPRLDDICGVMVIPKKLKPIRSDCVPCEPRQILYAPKLGRPVKSYDDSIDPPMICEPEFKCPARLDEKMPIPDKKLPKYTAGNCPPCMKNIATISPPIPRLVRRFEDKDPPRICPEEEPCIMMDGDIKVERKVLPELGPPGCVVTKPFKPSICPKIVRLRKRVPDKDRPECDPMPDKCNIDPPRLDDICCVQVKSKILPPFNPRYYPQDQEVDYCYREPFDIGNVCCFPPKPKSKSVFLPEKPKKDKDSTCVCEAGWGIDGEMEK